MTALLKTRNEPLSTVPGDVKKWPERVLLQGEDGYVRMRIADQVLSFDAGGTPYITPVYELSKCAVTAHHVIPARVEFILSNRE